MKPDSHGQDLDGRNHNADLARNASRTLLKFRASFAALRENCISCSLVLSVATAVCLVPGLGEAQQSGREWIRLFNGRDLNDWIVKIKGHDVGDNYARTFRVDSGRLKVAYDGYQSLNNQFGHLFYREPFSDYHLVVEYRFTGNWLPDTPDWAKRNSGAMLHSQDPKTMPKDQDFPISIEFQLLGGLGDGKARTTANMCSPGTDVTMNGTKAASHCVSSTSKTYDGDGWVRAEAIVWGDSLITHIVEGDTVMRYTAPRIGGGNVNGHDPAQKVDGRPLRSGYIALQSEGHPIEFRKVELKVLRRR